MSAEIRKAAEILRAGGLVAFPTETVYGLGADASNVAAVARLYAVKRGLKAIIAGAGGAAHLAGVVAAHTTLPVLGVPMPSKHLQGLDSLLSTVQMPKGIPVATFAIGEAGAANAALYAVAMLALTDSNLQKKLAEFRAKQAEAVRKTELPKP